MLQALFQVLSSCFMFLILHITRTNSFPKPLSPKEENEYLAKFKNGDLSAKNKLVEHNLRLVAHIVKKYYSSNVDQDDLVSIGTIGLIKAINTFDESKNIKLSSYASRCIENEILMYFRNNKKSLQDISLNETIDADKDGNPLSLIDIMSIDDNFITDIEVKINSEKLTGFMKELPARERLILELNKLNERSLKIADRISIIREELSSNKSIRW